MTTRQKLAGLAMCITAVLVIIAALTRGAVNFGPATFNAILHGHFDDSLVQVFIELRLPRVCIGLIVGAALALSGALLQGLLRNPLVDPYLTGSSAGASLAIAIGEVCRLPPAYLPIAAFAAALAVAFTTLALARTRFGISAERLILAGVALSALSSAIVTLLVLTVPSLGESASILAWLGGSLAGRGWSEIHWVAPYAVIGGVSALFAAPILNLLRVGEERALALGLDGRHSGAFIVAVAALLTAVAVSLAGMIGFVGMIVPHVVRRLVGGDARLLLPFAAIGGATTIVAADWLARSIVAPLELPLGVLLAFAGVPAFLILAFHSRSGAGFSDL